MKKWITVFLAIVAVVLILDMFSGFERKGVSIISVDSEQVYVRNLSDEEHKFMVVAECVEDYKLELVKTPILIGYDKTLTTFEFTIKPRERKAISMVFVDEQTEMARNISPDVVRTIVLD